IIALDRTRSSPLIGYDHRLETLNFHFWHKDQGSDDRRFDPTDAEQGLFIGPVDAAGLLTMSEAVKVEEFTDITPKVLTFRLPDGLSPGFYTLEVRAKYGKSGLRVGRLEAVLAVA
ncbi:MAG: DUF4469 domain-containing protein, partial [Anaerolineales bacterium]|nr:DUF4469 domain-containing protein [Anaerolineales bacterium]